MSLEIDLKRNNFFDLNNIKLFELKCNQKIINYSKRNILRIFFRYYFLIFYTTFINKREKKSKKIYSLIISYLDNVNRYRFLEDYDRYRKYQKLDTNIFFFFLELLSFPKYIIQYIKLKSNVKNQIFDAYLRSTIIIEYTKKNNIGKVVFFGYDYSLVFLAATLILNKHNIETVQYCNSGYLGVHNLEVANTIFFRTDIQKEYAELKHNIFISKNIYSLNHFTKQVEINDTRIGVYTSGFYARETFGKEKYLKEGIKAEKLMLKVIKKYALINKHIDIVLFIHLHNNVENIEDAKIYYSDILALNNVRLQNINENSIENFGNYNLGITCLSEIFFDRVERGYKAILLNPFFVEDFITNTKLSNITLYGESDKVLKQINYFTKLSEFEYFKLLK